MYRFAFCRAAPIKRKSLRMTRKGRCRKMTERQKRFCEEYLIDLNATQAAIRAGYSPKTAQEQGSKLLSKVIVRARIDNELAERSKRTGVTADRIVRELARIAFVSAPDVINLDKATVVDGAADDDLAAIASVKVKTSTSDSGDMVEREIKLADKIKALELLGRHNGMFTDNINLTGDVGVQILNDVPKDSG